jgi:hypothetical protein
MSNQFSKDPQATLDFKWDWSNWLANSEVISSVTITAPTGITVSNQSNTTNTVTVWLSGGTAGVNYDVTCKITTSNTPARIDERTISITCVDR